MRDEEDAFGHLLRAVWNGEPASEIVERDDGYVDTGDPTRYFASVESWPAYERKVIAEAEGRVLDVGCGAGRHALYLQERGLSVTAIDVSPGAVEVSRARGVRDARVLPVTRVGRHLGPVDTVLMLGNNFGLLADARRAARLLGRFAKLTGGGRILVESLNPYETDNPAHFAYHERNRRRGRMPGQLRIRVRYRSWKTPWFDYLFVSPSEMAALVSAAGWEVASVYEGGGPQFAAVLRQRRRSPWESRPAEPAGQAGSPSDDGIDARGLAPGTLAANVVAGRPGPASVVGQLRSSQTQELRCDDGVHGST